MAAQGEKEIIYDKPSSIRLNATTSSEPGFEVTHFVNDHDEDPHKWSSVRRWSIVVAASLMTMMSIFATSIITPAAPQIIDTFNVNNDLYQTLLVSIWELGEGIGPFVSAPLSERFGRSIVFHTSNLIGLVCIVASGLSINISMLVAFRFLGGFFLNAPTLTPAIIGDVIRPCERGKTMAIGMGLRQIGFFAAPIVGAFINQALGWRWTQWILAIALGAFGGLALLVVPETYAVKISRRKTARSRLVTTAHGPSFDYTTVWTTMARPVKILFSSPAVLLVSIYTGLTCGLLVLVLTTLTPILEQYYHFSEGSVGLAYIAFCVGCVFAMMLYGFTSDRYLEYRKTQDGCSRPEHRLIHTLLGSCTLPVGFIWYGWTSVHKVHYIAPLSGTAVIGFSLTLVILPSENYLVDAHGEYSASAVAACMILRAVFGATFPLLGPPLYNKLGLGWGNSLLALISAIFVPLLAFLVRSGGR